MMRSEIKAVHMQPPTHHALFLGVLGLFTLFMALLAPIANVFGADSYQINDGANQTINEHSICRNVTNNSGQSIFVPTKTATEWNDFINSTFAGTAAITLTTCGQVCSTPSTAKGFSCTGTTLGTSTQADMTACHSYCQTVASSSCCQLSGTTCTATDGTYGGAGFNNSVLCSDAADACSSGGLTLADNDYTDFYLTTRSCGQLCTDIDQQRTCSSGTLSGSSSYSEGTCPAEDACTDCTLDGVTVTHGNSYTFFSNASPSCGTVCTDIDQSRTCTNGTLSGSSTFNQSSCTDPSSCQTCFTPWTTFGQYVCLGTLNSSTSGTNESSCHSFCEATSSTTCCMRNASGTCHARQGSATAISSSWYVTTCSTGTPVNCSLSGITVLHGNSRNFYSFDFPSCPAGCADVDFNRVCVNGLFTGDNSFSYANCTDPDCGGTTNCTLDGVTVNHLDSYVFYSDAAPSCGTVCTDIDLSRTCNNGTLSGLSTFDKATCTDPTGCGASCTTQTVNWTTGAFSCSASATGGIDGTVRNVSDSSTPGVGSAAFRCDNATWVQDSGSCGGANCLLDGVTVNHGDSHVFYSSSAPSCGTTCLAVGQSRTCNNGTLDGSSSFSNASCTDPVGCCNSQTVNWGSCSGMAPAASNGDLVPAVDNTPIQTGGASFRCTTGSFVQEGAQACCPGCSPP